MSSRAYGIVRCMATAFGAWPAARRGVRGEPGFVSQAELARRMGVDPTYVSQLERRDAPPSWETRRRIGGACPASSRDQQHQKRHQDEQEGANRTQTHRAP